MSNFKERLIDELNQLSKRVMKLTEFIHTEDFRGLTYANKVLLRKQLVVENELNDILSVRIELLGAQLIRGCYEFQ